jgi:hypothetical protein
MTAVSVTAGHIAKGVRDSCWLCPVALAVKEAFPDAELVAVDSAHITMGGGPLRGGRTEIDLPDAATRFIEAFDLGDPVGPFTFELDYPAVTR